MTDPWEGKRFYPDTRWAVETEGDEPPIINLEYLNWIERTFIALQEDADVLLAVAMLAWHPNNCETQLSGDKPCNCGYQKAYDALPKHLQDNLK